MAWKHKAILVSIVVGAAALALTDPSRAGAAIAILCSIATVLIVTTKKGGG